MSEKKQPSRRIIELDLLRGYFIIIIVLDHLQFWPSPFQYLTGQGRLWASAAEGFFIISGLLIGYLRAYKGAKTPLKDLSKKLLSRAGTLWLWCIIVTTLFLLLVQILPSSPLLPKLPDAATAPSLPVLVWNVAIMHYSSDWIYFLRLYAIMLTLTPLFLWFIRKGLWWVAGLLSLGAYLFSLLSGFGEAALQWQLLFFGAALIGWKFEAILQWFGTRPRLKTTVLAVLITGTIVTMLLSYFMVHGWSYVESETARISRDSYISVRANVDPLFSNTPLAPLRLLLSFFWFSGLLALFHVLKKYLVKWFGWLLLVFGQASLTGYIIQAILLVFVVTLVQLDGSPWINTVASVVVLLVTWGLMKLPFIRKLLPQ